MSTWNSCILLNCTFTLTDHHGCQQTIGSKPYHFFYLTNNLTPEQDDRIRHDLIFGEAAWLDGLECCFVPLKTGEEGQVNGTLEDMWEIFCAVFTYEGPQDYHTIYFIDEQSAIDMTVIGVCRDYFRGKDEQRILKGTPHWNIRGLLHGRLVCEVACSNFEMTETGNGLLQDYAGDLLPYPRPDWPGHRILP